MSEPELPGIPPAPKPSWQKRLFARRKWAGWATIGLGGLPFPLRLFRLGEDVDFAISVARSIGGELGTIAAIIASPFFGIALIAYGVAHLLFVGEPTRALHHPAWAYLGWSIFGICLTAIVVTAGWGAVHAYIQTQISRGIQTQQAEDRRLSQEQAEKLLSVFKPIASEFPNNIQVEAISASPDAAGYALQFMHIFHRAGLTVNGLVPTDNNTTSLFSSTGQVASSQMRGLYIGIRPGVNVTLPERAIRFQATLREAGFNASLTGWQGVGPDDFVFVVSYR